MPKTIVWASDGSESAARALPHATALLDGEGAMLIAVYVVQESSEDKADSAAADGHAPALVDQVRSLVADVTERGVKGVRCVVSELSRHAAGAEHREPRHRGRRGHDRGRNARPLAGRRSLRRQRCPASASSSSVPGARRAAGRRAARTAIGLGGHPRGGRAGVDGGNVDPLPQWAHVVWSCGALGSR